MNLGWWPMLAPVKSGEIRDAGLLGVNDDEKLKMNFICVEMTGQSGSGIFFGIG